LMRLPDTVVSTSTVSTSTRLRPPLPARDPTRCIARFDCIMINFVGWCQEDAMKITRAEAYLCDLAVERPRTDAIQAFIKQETIFVEIETDDGFQGTGYAYTVGTGGRAILQLLRVDLLHRLIGEDARQI